MPDVLAWEADDAEQSLLNCGFKVIRVETFPLRPYAGDTHYWRVVRQKLLTKDQVELVVSLDIGFDLARKYL